MIHFARHVEEIAVAVLPRDIEDEEDSDIEDEEGSDTNTLDYYGSEVDLSSPVSDQPMNCQVSRKIDEIIDLFNSEDEESSTIKCVCGYSDDDGNTVLCEQCDTWQHISCYYLLAQYVPDSHFCTDCVPRHIDVKAAIELQREKRREGIQANEPALRKWDTVEGAAGSGPVFLRLSREHHDILEAHFQREPKPTTKSKKRWAEDLGVPLDKIDVSMTYERHVIS